MSVPEVEPAAAQVWVSMDSAAKRAKVLAVAGELFAREGVEFPMPALAKAVGVGVGSLYRQVGSKDDVLAALVVQRLERFGAVYREALGSDDPVQALLDVIAYTLDETMQDRVAKISFELALTREDVQAVRASAAETLGQLIEESKAAGGLRPDATVMDLRILFRLAREAEKITPGGGARVAELMVAGLRPQPAA